MFKTCITPGHILISCVFIFQILSFAPPLTQPDLIQTETIYGETVHPVETIGAPPFLHQFVPRSPITTHNAVSLFLFFIDKFIGEFRISLVLKTYLEQRCICV